MRDEPSRAEQRLISEGAAREAREAALQLEITLLGDGKETPEYQKRLELRDRLAQHPFVANVTIPELLHEAHPQATLDEVERSAIDEADVVVCLEGPARPPLGVYTEVVGYFDETEAEKWYLCLPTGRDAASGEDPLVVGLAHQKLESVELFRYEPTQWEKCGRITAACERRIRLMARRELIRRSNA